MLVILNSIRSLTLQLLEWVYKCVEVCLASTQTHQNSVGSLQYLLSEIYLQPLLSFVFCFITYYQNPTTWGVASPEVPCLITHPAANSIANIIAMPMANPFPNQNLDLAANRSRRTEGRGSAKANRRWTLKAKKRSSAPFSRNPCPRSRSIPSLTRLAPLTHTQ
jgi:hypothetical protein